MLSDAQHSAMPQCNTLDMNSSYKACTLSKTLTVQENHIKVHRYLSNHLIKVNILFVKKVTTVIVKINTDTSRQVQGQKVIEISSVLYFVKKNLSIHMFIELHMYIKKLHRIFNHMLVIEKRSFVWNYIPVTISF